MASCTKILLNQTRNYATKKMSGGVKYGYITYYPRHPDHVDPPITPSKLLMVQRIKPIKGTPYWNRDTLVRLGLTEKSSDIVIVKNIPEVNRDLWSIKHLVKITPIDFPNGMPDDDLSGTYLHENGKLYVTPKIDPVRYESTEKFEQDPKRLDKETLTKYLRLRWLSGL
ncbi:39S ribosomal protein L30, mitochondrial [Cephus cinctus]|uniref:Large ribosomal subunit protein uL30m n=1 Tax=Cephus cinctus TaxID=211228 RepID=A0AAJ7BY40_CEPCN|nr:39S ribosomal protein L30, mitochondrial [Cephus cinctus]XP_015596775.1 39S ribosomal protein L30, mitochondrial [Cephus cinctus]